MAPVEVKMGLCAALLLVLLASVAAAPTEAPSETPTTPQLPDAKLTLSLSQIPNNIAEHTFIVSSVLLDLGAIEEDDSNPEDDSKVPTLKPDALAVINGDVTSSTRSSVGEDNDKEGSGDKDTTAERAARSIETASRAGAR